MIHRSSLALILPLALYSLTPACIQRPLDPDNSEADEMTPEMEVGDPWNCGEANVSCVGPLGIGECIDGECQGRLSGCWEAGTSCDELCEQAGGACDRSCSDAAAFGWMAATSVEALDMCAMADAGTATALTVACDEPLPFSDYTAIRCCCR